jgi:curved DNA-binding protein CbpA
MTDWYEVLQINPKAEQEVVRAAYRVLARKYHPDHGGDPKRMMALNDAWDVLGDPERRAAYDATRAAAPRPQTGSWPAAATSVRPEAAAPAVDPSHAGPPPGRPSGTVLDFGRYSGWSLGEIARHDTVYLEWLLRSTLGRRLRTEIEALLAQRRGPGAGNTASSHGLPRR